MATSRAKAILRIVEILLLLGIAVLDLEYLLIDLQRAVVVAGKILYWVQALIDTKRYA